MAVSIFANPRFMEELLAASADAITKNPRNKAASDVHDALNDLHDLYSPNTSTKNTTVVLPNEKRHEILTRFERSAKTGNMLALFLAGICKENGVGCLRDPKGIHFINVAAEWDCALALNYLGLSNFRTAPTIAVKYFQRAAELGYALGYKNLGLCYLYKIGTAQNIAAAITCFKTAGSVARSEIAMVRNYLDKQLARMQPVEHNIIPARLPQRLAVH